MSEMTRGLGKPKRAYRSFPSVQGTILKLIRDAEENIKRGEIGSALWRLVDAAGELSYQANPDAMGQEKNPTGRGFFIGERK